MTYQSQSAIEIGYEVQSGLGTPASGAGATVFRPSGGNGLGLTKALIQSNEVRRDGMETRGRHGSRQVSGSYEGELSLGTYDSILEAIFRGTFATTLTITEATAGLTSVTTGANSIVASAGSWITAGLKVGDVIRATGLATAANNSKNIRLTGVSALTLTTAETLVVDAVADTAFTITRPRKLINPGSGNLIERYFTVMEREIDIDAEELYTDCKFGSFRMQMQPNGMVTCTTGLMGRDMTAPSGASSPTFTSPTATTTLPMAVADAVIRLDNGDLVDITALEFTLDLGLSAPPVLGNGGVAPDVFAGVMRVSNASVTLLRSDLSKVQDFLDETQMQLWVNLVENESEPKDFCSFFFGNCSIAGANKSAINKEGGPRTMTMPLLIGAHDDGGSAYDATNCKFQTSAA